MEKYGYNFLNYILSLDVLKLKSSLDSSAADAFHFSLVVTLKY